MARKQFDPYTAAYEKALGAGPFRKGMFNPDVLLDLDRSPRNVSRRPRTEAELDRRGTRYAPQRRPVNRTSVVQR